MPASAKAQSAAAIAKRVTGSVWGMSRLGTCCSAEKSRTCPAKRDG